MTIKIMEGVYYFSWMSESTVIIRFIRTMTVHGIGTFLASAAAGGLSLLFIAAHPEYNENDHSQHHKRYDYRCDIVNNKAYHRMTSFILILLSYLNISLERSTLLVRSEEHEEDHCCADNCSNKSDNIHASGKEKSCLINDE